MNRCLMNVILATLLAFYFGGAPHAADDALPYTSVTAERLEAPADGDWLQYRRTYNSWGYSPLKAINRNNVARLTTAWSFATGQSEAHQAPPIVNDGVMFISTPGNQVIALDARSGEQLWRYRRELPEDLFQLHPTNRGVALWGDRVYLATVDAYLVALDARTGEVVWETEVEDYLSGYYMTLAPLAVNGKIMIGMSGARPNQIAVVASEQEHTLIAKTLEQLNAADSAPEKQLAIYDIVGTDPGAVRDVLVSLIDSDVQMTVDATGRWDQ